MQNLKKSSVEPRKHSDFSASASERWLYHCPGSVILSRGLEGEESRAAAEGTAAHELAAVALEKRICPTKIRLGTLIPDEYKEFVDDDMRFEVKKYFDYCIPYFDKGDCFIEKKFDLSWVAPKYLIHMDKVKKGEFAPEGKFTMFGTGDFVCVEPWGDIDVIDLKFGRGKIVEAEGNSQLAYYGIGGADIGQWDFGKVRNHIFQPRRNHFPVAELSEPELRKWVSDFRTAVVAIAENADSPQLKAGKHCDFCPAKHICPERNGAIEKGLVQSFGKAPKKGRLDPKLLSPDQISEVLNNAKVIEDWLSSVRARAMFLLEKGESIPGYKLVSKRGERVWKDPERLEQILAGNLNAFTEPELKSPAQLEKILGKSFVEKYSTKIARAGRTLARDNDRREKLISKVDEDFADFEDL